jgi:hypothetical protein
VHLPSGQKLKQNKTAADKTFYILYGCSNTQKNMPDIATQSSWKKKETKKGRNKRKKCKINNQSIHGKRMNI